MSPVLKRKPEKQKIPSKYVLLIFTLVCMILMVLTFSSPLSDSFLRSSIGTIIIPFQKGIGAVSGWVIDRQDEQATLEALISENQALQEQIDALTNENILLQQDKYELTNLRELYELDAQYSEYDKVGARIISWDANNWFSSFIIDKGTEDGLCVDMNVIAGSGLVGRITETGPNWSRVVSIISDNSNVSAYVLHTQDNLIVSGDLQLMNQGYMSYSQLIDTDNLVAKGDKVVTSYISDKYLPGILIGYIATVETDSNNITKSGYITPVVDFSHLSEVLVITELKETLEE